MPDAELIAAIRNKYQALRLVMDEKVRRRWAACEARAIGWGGITAVAAATGLSRPTIRAGLAEVQGGASRSAEDQQPEVHRVRRGGGGRRRLTAGDRTLVKDLQALLASSTRGDPQSPLLWTSKSTRHLADALVQQGHHVSHHTVARLLEDLNYSLQANRKTKEGSTHRDRDAQFEHINKQVRAFQKRGQPVVSVDTKKKELIGDFKNAGREWHSMGHPVEVRTKDFVDKQRGKGIPYGVYDLTANTGWVSVGLDHDTAQFAAESLRRWWQQTGARVYPKAEELLVTADAGGSNGYRIRLWKVALQELADAIGLRISVCHVPPGTSKWNKIERESRELRSRSSSWLAMAAPGCRVSAGITRVLVGEGNKEHRHDEQGDNQFSVAHQSSSFCEAIEMRGGSAGRPIPRLSYTCWNGGRDRSLLMDSTILHTKRSRSPIPSFRQDRCLAKGRGLPMAGSGYAVRVRTARVTWLKRIIA